LNRMVWTSGAVGSLEQLGLGLVYLGFWGLGLNLYWVYLPTLLLGLPLLAISRGFEQKLTREMAICLLGLVLYLFFLFSFGWKNFLWESTVKSSVVVTFCLVVPALSVLWLKPLEFRNAFAVYVFGIGCFVLSGVLYTAFYLGLESGRGQIWLPWRSMPFNSPEFANLTALVAVFASIWGIVSKRALGFSAAAVILVISFAIAQYLDARSFYVIMGGAFALFIYFYRWSKVVYLFLGGVGLYFLGDAFLSWIIIDTTPSVVMSSDLVPLNSNQDFASTNIAQGRGSFFLRFYLWGEGAHQLVMSPLGGFRPSEISHWFHNLWLDTAATSGWLPLIILLLLNTGTPVQLLIAHRDKASISVSLIVVQLVCLAIMFQDVVVEGNFRLLAIYMMAMSANFHFYARNKRFPTSADKA